MIIKIKDFDTNKNVVTFTNNNVDYQYNISTELLSKHVGSKYVFVSTENKVFENMIKMLKIQFKSYKEYNKKIK